jgi:hypothetical protein
MERLRAAVIGCIAVACLAYAVAIFADYPTVVVCERGQASLASVDVSSTRKHGYFDERRIGPCVAFFHHSRAPGGTTAEPWGD